MQECKDRQSQELIIIIPFYIVIPPLLDSLQTISDILSKRSVERSDCCE